MNGIPAMIFRKLTVHLLFTSAALVGHMSFAQTPSDSVDTTRYAVTIPGHAAGQTVTQLPDGRWLLAGGIVSGQVSDAISIADGPNPQLIGLKLLTARTGHTTTVLPDGSLFVFGGTDANGNALANAEIIDLSSGTAQGVATAGLTPRTRHTATLLTDGRVLIAGGIGSDGITIAPAQLWNPDTTTADSWNPLLQTPRYDHSATLLATGEGRIAGGHGDSIPGLLPTELFNPSTNIFERTAADDPSVDLTLAATRASRVVADTLPAAEAVDVPVNTRIAFRFTEPLSMQSLNESTLSLVGPAGAVPVKVVGAEGGMLAFLTPSAELTPGTTYTAFLQGATDLAGRQIALASVRFATHRYEAPSSVRADTEVFTANPPAATSVAAKPAVAQSVLVVTAPAKTAKPNSTPEPTAMPEKERDDGDIEDWSPRDANRHGQWRILGLAGDPALAATAATASDLSAAAGQTGVAGHVLKINGKPLAGVAVSIGRANTTTDADGRFLLTNLAAGTQQMLVDGTVVTRNGWHYTKHYIEVQINAAHMTTLAQAVYLPRVDPATEIAISSPAAHEIVLTHPAIPGLEVHIPKGTVLREYGGKIVTTISITPLPVDRAPYPTPKNFSAYFTLQPGGAFVDGDATKSIKVIYPNYLGLAPGAQVNFYNYDPGHGGWGVYGHGIVTKDGKQVAPDEDVGFRQIMGFGLAIGSTVPPKGRPAGGCVSGGDPVDCATGFFTHTETDMAISDSVPISVTRTYQSNDQTVHVFGVGTNISYAMYLYTPDSDSDVYLVLSDGSQIHYALQSTSPYVWKNLDSPTPFYGSIMQYVPGQNGLINTTNDLITVTLTDNTVLSFASDGSLNQLLSIADPNGNTVLLTLQNGRSGPITQVTSPNGRSIQFTYDSCSRITQATDNLKRTVVYSYYPPATTCTEPLYHVKDQDGYVETYNYDSSNRLQNMLDKKSTRVFYNNYNAANQVLNQTLADGAYWQFAYSLVSGIETTTITDPRNYIRQDTFNASGYLTQEILAKGQTVQQTYTLVRNTSNLLASVTDPLNRLTTYNNYDAYGNPGSVTRLSGTANAVTSYFTYDPIFHHLATYEDIYGNTTRYYYDSSGNLNQVTNGIGNSWTIQNNGAGLAALITDPLGHTVQFGYQGADLASVTDGLNRTSTRFTDDVGRVLTATDPLGNAAQYGYDNRDQLLQITDPMNGITTMTYDQNGNLATVTDPRNLAAHGYTYDSRNRLHIYKDPLGNSATYNFDGMGNLTSKIDRKNQETQYTYDPLNRLQLVTFADATTINIQWDAGNRPHIITDSKNGVITQTYDGLDRLTEEQSPQGTVVYAYNLTNPRFQMTVNSYPTISYSVDAALRLTSITQGSNSVTLSPDAANRPGTITYPNGIVGTYGFDAANQLLSLSYAKGSTSIGALGYTYDLAGRQITKTGTFATLEMPTAVSQSTYDAANRLTEWNGTALTYDNNGNLLTNTTGSYTWNVRDQLTATSTGAGVFSYDAFGRRVSATVNGTTNTYLYDRSNPALISATQIIGGQNADEVYAQVSSAGTTSVLRDGLNSTIALTSSADATTGSYAYSPYGATTSTGTSTTTLQFTGRENDGVSGLYYYRARYYSPQLSRFISQDPIGLAGGINTYAYADGDPISRIDPLGLWSTAAHNAIIQAAFPGLNPNLVSAVEDGSAAVDMLVLQLIGDPAQHAMSRPGEDPSAARGRACQFVNDRLARYRQMADSSEPSVQYMAYFELGEAMHTIMDSTSPAHTGFQPWSILHPGGHGDLPSSIEDLAHLTPQLLQQTVNKMNGILNGSSCGCSL